MNPAPRLALSRALAVTRLSRSVPAPPFSMSQSIPSQPYRSQMSSTLSTSSSTCASVRMVMPPSTAPPMDSRTTAPRAWTAAMSSRSCSSVTPPPSSGENRSRPVPLSALVAKASRKTLTRSLAVVSRGEPSARQYSPTTASGRGFSALAPLPGEPVVRTAATTPRARATATTPVTTGTVERGARWARWRTKIPLPAVVMVQVSPGPDEADVYPSRIPRP